MHEVIYGVIQVKFWASLDLEPSQAMRNIENLHMHTPVGTL